MLIVDAGTSIDDGPVDASVMPDLISAHRNAAVLTIADALRI